MANGATLQLRWKFCNDCFALFFSGDPGLNLGVCPAGGGHRFTNSTSGDYPMLLSLDGDFEPGIRAGQRDWRFCHKCSCMWFNGKLTNGVCPAGGSHSRSGSGDYAIINQGPDFSDDMGHERNWRFCGDCFVLWFNGKSSKGVCPAGGGHIKSSSGDYALSLDSDGVFNLVPGAADSSDARSAAPAGQS